MVNPPIRRRRRRTILSCLECHVKKLKCDREQPCTPCTTRGKGGTCTYDKGSRPAASTAAGTEPAIVEGDMPLLRQAQEYGYTHAEVLGSLGILPQAVSGVDAGEIAASESAVESSNLRAQYHIAIRRLPSKTLCDILVKHFFKSVNWELVILEEVIFMEQLARWRALVYDFFTRNDEEMESLVYFPALLFQVLALSLFDMLPSPDERLEELKLGPSQPFFEIAKEFSDCGAGLATLLEQSKCPINLITVQHMFVRSCWFANLGYLIVSWTLLTQAIKEAQTIGLHLEPKLPASNNPETLIKTVWENELRKRVWTTLYSWDVFCAVTCGRRLQVSLQDCTVTPAVDCQIPGFDERMSRLPIPRMPDEKPTSFTVRWLRYKMCLRMWEIMTLESHGGIPRDPSKVQELNEFAMDFQRNVPAFYRPIDPDTRWDEDEDCLFVPTHRNFLGNLINSFFICLHRPYVLTRPESQTQVFERSLATLELLNALFPMMRDCPSRYVGLTWVTFDAAVPMALLLTLNPERYQDLACFPRVWNNLVAAKERLEYLRPKFSLAATGSEILQTLIGRISAAKEQLHSRVASSTSASTSVSSGSVRTDSSPQMIDPTAISPENWEFGPYDGPQGPAHDPSFANFDFSNLSIPIPIKELLLDDLDGEMYANADWPALQDPGLVLSNMGNQTMDDPSENQLWSFLTNQ